MSSNIYKIQIVVARNKNLDQQFVDSLKACVASGGGISDSPDLLAVFQPWAEAVLLSFAELKNGIEIALDCSSASMWSHDILEAIVQRGAGFVGVEAYYDQVDAEQAFYYKGLDRISNSEFPAIKYGDLEREIEALFKKGKDKELVKRVKDGLNPNLMVEGDPLLQLSIEYQLSRLPYALLDAGANFKVTVAKGQGANVFSMILFRHGEIGRTKLIDALVKDGFDINEKGFPGTPLMHVASFAASNEDALPLLDLTLHLGADVNAHIYEGEDMALPGSLLFNTTRYRGAYQPQVHERLVAAGAKVVPASKLSEKDKAQRLIDREPAAETVAELAATGFDFNVIIDLHPLIFSALATDLKLALQVLNYLEVEQYVENAPVRLLGELYRNLIYNGGDRADAEEVLQRLEKAGLKPNSDAADREYGASICDYFSIGALPDRPMPKAGELPAPYSIVDVVKAMGLGDYRWA